MPPPAADLEEALKKKGGLTLSQLANYDDVITDALVDKVYFWSTIRKLKPKYNGNRHLKEVDVIPLIQKEVIINKDPVAAQEKLLQVNGIARFHKSLKTEDEKEHFVRHLRKYINIYLPDCPFEVCTTNRYTITTNEACIIARKAIKRGESVKFLSGIQVEMTEKEEKELSSRTDFSIVLSSRRKRPSLFLGPARFANHDCDSNAKLNTTGPHGIHIVARKDIAIGDEITVTYGEDYFGEDNCECLCCTCEKAQRNGWDPRGPIIHGDSSDEEESEDEDADETSARRRAEPSRPAKRKREDGDEDAEDDQDRKRGRTRKHGPDEDPRNNSASMDRDGNGRFLCKAEKSPNDKNKTATPKSAQGRAGTSVVDDPDEPLLDRVFRLLGSVADRQDRKKRGLSASDPILITPPESSSAASDIDSATDAKEHSGETTSNGRFIVRGYKGMFVRQDRASKPGSTTPEDDDMAKMNQESRSGPMDSSKIPPVKSEAINQDADEDTLATADPRASLGGMDPLRVPKLSSVKKERSFSSLRNVQNANEPEVDPYSVPASPAPQLPAQFVKRGRGRPRKYPRSDDIVRTEAQADTGESPSSSMGTSGDSSSAASLASSATSLDNFAAGTIAQGICEMLTTDDVEETVGSVNVTRTTNTKTRTTVTKTRTSARFGVSADEEDDTLLSPDKLDRGRSAQLRKSPRSGSSSGLFTPPIRSIEKNEAADDSDDEDVERGEPRIPGDYTLCRALLTTSCHRWVECRNCDEHFVQPEAFLTRIACPRCERHSKLYGYYWPKTDKEGKHDKEERVLDHREIHRYIPPDEEREERKGRKTLADALREKEMSEWERSESDEHDDEGRLTRRGRISPKQRTESERRSARKTM